MRENSKNHKTREIHPILKWNQKYRFTVHNLFNVHKFANKKLYWGGGI